MAIAQKDDKKAPAKGKNAVKNKILIDPDEMDIAVPDDDNKVNDMINNQQQTQQQQQQVTEGADNDNSDSGDKPKPSPKAKGSNYGKGKAIQLLQDLAKKHKNPEELQKAAEAITKVDPKRVASALKKAAKSVAHADMIKNEVKAVLDKKKEADKAKKSKVRQKAKAQEKDTKTKAAGVSKQYTETSNTSERLRVRGKNDAGFKRDVLDKLPDIKKAINDAPTPEKAAKIFKDKIGHYDSHLIHLVDKEHYNETHPQLGELMYTSGKVGGKTPYDELLRSNAQRHSRQALETRMGKPMDDKEHEAFSKELFNTAKRKYEEKLAERNKASEAKPRNKEINIGTGQLNKPTATATAATETKGKPSFVDKMKDLVTRLKGRKK